MAKKGSRGSRRTRKMMSSQQGGNAPDSAWGYVMNTVGDGWTQFMDTFSVQPGENGPERVTLTLAQGTYGS